MVRAMIIYEPIMLAMPLAKRIKDQILRERKIPDSDDLRKILTSFGLEEMCLNRGLALFRSKYILALLIPSKEYATVDIISLTGRYCPEELYELADYVTEMREIKHPYHKGVMARKGVEY